MVINISSGGFTAATYSPVPNVSTGAGSAASYTSSGQQTGSYQISTDQGEPLVVGKLGGGVTYAPSAQRTVSKPKKEQASKPQSSSNVLSSQANKVYTPAPNYTNAVTKQPGYRPLGSQTMGVSNQFALRGSTQPYSAFSDSPLDSPSNPALRPKQSLDTSGFDVGYYNVGGEQFFLVSGPKGDIYAEGKGDKGQVQSTLRSLARFRDQYGYLPPVGFNYNGSYIKAQQQSKKTVLLNNVPLSNYVFSIFGSAKPKTYNLPGGQSVREGEPIIGGTPTLLSGAAFQGFGGDFIAPGTYHKLVGFSKVKAEAIGFVNAFAGRRSKYGTFMGNIGTAETFKVIGPGIITAAAGPGFGSAVVGIGDAADVVGSKVVSRIITGSGLAAAPAQIGYGVYKETKRRGGSKEAFQNVLAQTTVNIGVGVGVMAGVSGVATGFTKPSPVTKTGIFDTRIFGKTEKTTGPFMLSQDTAFGTINKNFDVEFLRNFDTNRVDLTVSKGGNVIKQTSQIVNVKQRFSRATYPFAEFRDVPMGLSDRSVEVNVVRGTSYEMGKPSAFKETFFTQRLRSNGVGSSRFYYRGGTVSRPLPENPLNIMARSVISRNPELVVGSNILSTDVAIPGSFTDFGGSFSSDFVGSLGNPVKSTGSSSLFGFGSLLDSLQGARPSVKPFALSLFESPARIGVGVSGKAAILSKPSSVSVSTPASLPNALVPARVTPATTGLTDSGIFLSSPSSVPSFTEGFVSPAPPVAGGGTSLFGGVKFPSLPKGGSSFFRLGRQQRRRRGKAAYRPSVFGIISGYKGKLSKAERKGFYINPVIARPK